MSDDPFGTPDAPASSGDFDFVADIKETPFPSGVYKLRCVDVQKAISQSSAKPMFVWDFLIVDRSDMGVVKSWTTLDPTGRWKVIEYANAFGLSSVGDELRFNKRDVVGKFVVADMDLREYQGQKRPNIKKMFSITEYGEENVPSYAAKSDNGPDEDL